MSSFKINSFEEYQEIYKRSVDDPEGFWADIAGTFRWQKNGIKFWTGTLPSQMLNGLWVAN